MSPSEGRWHSSYSAYNHCCALGQPRPLLHSGASHLCGLGCGFTLHFLPERWFTLTWFLPLSEENWINVSKTVGVSLWQLLFPRTRHWHAWSINSTWQIYFYFLGYKVNIILCALMYHEVDECGIYKVDSRIRNNPTYNLVSVHVSMQLSDKKLYTIYTMELSNFSIVHKQMKSTTVDVHCFAVNICRRQHGEKQNYWDA